MNEQQNLYLPGFLEEHIGKNPLPPEVNYRPYLMLTSERITLANQSEIELFNESKFTKNKQLGELTYCYGHLIHRIETYINMGRCHVGDEYITVKDSFQNFTHGMSEQVKKDLINHGDSFSKPTLYRWTKKNGKRIVISQEMHFLTMLLRRDHDPDARMSNLTASEVGKIVVGRPCTIELKINAQVYEALIGYLHGGKQVKNGGVIPILRDAPAAIKDVMKMEQDSLDTLAFGFTKSHGGTVEKNKGVMKKLRYNDKQRVAYEMIEEYLHRQRFKERETGYTAQLPDVYPTVFPSKNAGDRVRFFFLTHIWGRVWNSSYKDCPVQFWTNGRILNVKRLDPEEEKAKFDRWVKDRGVATIPDNSEVG